jgi:membrane-associated phospholipid phosphatase
MNVTIAIALLATSSASLATVSIARAQGTPSPATSATSQKVFEAPDDARRRSDLTPVPVESRPQGDTIRFEADPVGDGALLGATVGFATLTELILSTGEIRPQQIDARFDTTNLLSIDRGAVSQHIDPNAPTFSNMGVITAVAFAALDPVLSGFRDGREAAIVDAFMYAEAATMAWGLTDIAKVAVRRPRPIAYITRDSAIAAGANPATYDNTSTDSSLSFFSGHAAVTSSIAAAATYIAFARSPHTARPWITLAAGLALTTFVSVERVRAGAHFPTDVIAGSLAGAGTGLLVVHLHREDTLRQRPLWIGMTPSGGGAGTGGTVTLGGLF